MSSEQELFNTYVNAFMSAKDSAHLPGSSDNPEKHAIYDRAARRAAELMVTGDQNTPAFQSYAKMYGAVRNDGSINTWDSGKGYHAGAPALDTNGDGKIAKEWGFGGGDYFHFKSSSDVHAYIDAHSVGSAVSNTMKMLMDGKIPTAYDTKVNAFAARVEIAKQKHVAPADLEVSLVKDSLSFAENDRVSKSLSNAVHANVTGGGYKPLPKLDAAYAADEIAYVARHTGVGQPQPATQLAHNDKPAAPPVTKHPKQTKLASNSDHHDNHHDDHTKKHAAPPPTDFAFIDADIQEEIGTPRDNKRGPDTEKKLVAYRAAHHIPADMKEEDLFAQIKAERATRLAQTTDVLPPELPAALSPYVSLGKTTVDLAPMDFHAPKSTPIVLSPESVDFSNYTANLPPADAFAQAQRAADAVKTSGTANSIVATTGDPAAMAGSKPAASTSTARSPS